MKRIGKRLLAMLLAISVLVPLFPASALAAGSETEPEEKPAESRLFSDVPEDAWFQGAVEYVYNHDIFKGISDDTFSPYGTMTRSMMVTVLGRLAQVDPAGYDDAPAFTDVASDSWYAPYVAWAAASGITEGVGRGRFAPEAPVTREQMAVFLWRFFRHIGAPLPEDVTDSLPGDYTAVPAYAREAVAALWRCGIFQGDGSNGFVPARELTRAEVAMLCMRVDTHLVDTGAKTYPDETKETGSGTSGGSGGNKPGDSGGDEPDKPSVSPEELYYEPDATENQTTATAQDQPTTFSITVKSSDASMTAEEVQKAITAADASESGDAAANCIQVSGSGGTYTITGIHSGYNAQGEPEVAKGFAPGHTYKIVLGNDKLTFEGQDASVREYDFTIKREEEMNLKLADDMVYIPAGSVDDITVNGQPVETLDVALVRVGENGTETNASEDTRGSFTYNGTIQEGSIAAIYEGLNPLQRNEDTEASGDGVISYVRITGRNGNTYFFEGAEMDEVLKTPDVFPLSDTYLTTQEDGNNAVTVTVPASAFVFSGDLYTEMGLDASAQVEEGDYIAFYSGYLDPAASDSGEQFSAENAGYAEITSVTFLAEEDSYAIAYKMVTLDEILNSMNTYVESDVDVGATMTEEDIAALEDSLESQAVESGFAQEAAEEIARRALQTNSLEQVRDEMGLTALEITRVGVVSDSGAAVRGSSLLAAPGGGGNKVEVEVNYTGIRADVDTRLEHFSGMEGLRVELTIPFTVSIQQSGGWALEIEFSPTFIQELRISVNASVDTVWDNWAYIIWWIDDFKVTASIDVFTFTDIDIDINVTSSDGQEDTPEKIEKLTNFVDEIKSFLDGGGADEEEVETLEARYAEMLQTDSDWVDLFSKNIYQVKKTLALVVTMWVSFDFVVSANVNVYIGMDFTYELGRRYIFTIMVFGGQATSDTVSLVPEEYNLEVYVMGKLGLRAGLRITIGVALIHKSVASAELVAEIGPYIELYGYFYYQLHYLEGQGKTSRAAGAMYVEVGLYAEMSANLSAIGGLLSWNPNIFSVTLPLWSAGNRYSIIRLEGAPELISFNYANCASLPSRFNTVSMDMKTGETHTASYGLKQVTIKVTNDAVRYDSTHNVLWANGTYPFDNLDPIEEGEVVVTLTEGANGKLAFNTEPLQWTIPFHWDKLQPSYSLFLITGGTPSWIELKGAYGSALEYDKELLEELTVDAPGSIFYGWVDAYSDNVYSTDTLPDTMPYGGAYLTATWTYLDKESISENYTITGFAPLDSVPTISFKYRDPGRIDTAVFQMSAIDKRTGERLTLPCAYDPELFQVTTDNPGIIFDEELKALRVPDIDVLDPLESGTMTITWIGGGGTFQREVPYSWDQLQPSYNILLVTGSDPGWIQFSAAYNEVVEYDWDLIERVTAPQPGRVFDYWKGAGEDEVYTNETLPERMPHMGLYLNAIWRPLDKDYINEHYTVTGFATLESVPDISMKYWDPYLFSTDVFQLTAVDKETREPVTLLCTYDPELFEVTTSIPEIAFDPSIVGLRPGDTSKLGPQASGTVTITWIGDGTHSVQRTLSFSWDDLQPSYSLFLVTGVSSPSYIQYNAPYEGEIAYDMELLAQVTADAPGRHFAGWSYNGEIIATGDLPKTMPYQGASIQAVWEAVPVEYTVNHYYALLPGEQPAEGQQAINFQGTWYVLGATTTPSADLGAYINANDSTVPKDGFTTETGYQDFGWLAVGTVLNHLYKREMYPLKLTCVDDEGAVIRSLSTMLPYGAKIVTPVPSIPVGYTFSGWGDTPETMPSKAVIYTATLTPSTDTPFTVEHYVQQSDNGTYVFDGTTTGYGTTNTSVKGSIDTVISGKLAELNAEAGGGGYSAAYNVDGITISGDGSTVVKVRYTLTDLYTATFLSENRTVGRVYFRTGETITPPEVEKEGFTAKWYYIENDQRVDVTSWQMTAGNKTFCADWISDTESTYTVEHYVQDTTGDGYQLVQTDRDQPGAVGQPATFTPLAAYGNATQFTTRYEPVNVAAGGSTVLKVYYDRRTYALTYHLNRDGASFTDSAVTGDTYTVKDIRYGATLSDLLDSGDVSCQGYVLAGWNTAAEGTGTAYNSQTTMPDSDVSLYAQWVDGYVITVKHYKELADHDEDAEDGGKYDMVNYEMETVTVPKGGETTYTPAVKTTYEHFRQPEPQQVTFGEASAYEVNYYYDRETYSLTVKYTGREYVYDETANASHIVETPDQQSVVTGVRYGQTLKTVFDGNNLYGKALRYGYVLDGFQDESGTKYEYMPAADITLDAVWAPATVTIRFGYDARKDLYEALEEQAERSDGAATVTVGGNGDVSLTLTYGEEFILPKIPGLEGLGSYSGGTPELSYKAGENLCVDGLFSREGILYTLIWETATSGEAAIIYSNSQLKAMEPGGSYRLGADLDYSLYTGVSVYGARENGKYILDGDGHSISNLRIATNDGSIDAKSLFQTLEDGSVISDLTISNMTLTDNWKVQYVGTVAARVTGNVTMDHVVVSSPTVALERAVKDNVYIGGLVGYVGDDKNSENSTVLTLNRCTVENAHFSSEGAEGWYEAGDAFMGAFVGCVAENASVTQGTDDDANANNTDYAEIGHSVGAGGEDANALPMEQESADAVTDPGDGASDFGEETAGDAAPAMRLLFPFRKALRAAPPFLQRKRAA